MGRHAFRFVQLTDDDRDWLEERWKHDTSHSTRSRAHAILLNSQRYSIVEISRILGVSYETVENWLDRWDEHHRDGIKDIARIGRPPKLNNKDRNILCEIVEQHPQQPAVMLEQLRERTKKLISRPTLRRVLRDLGTAGSARISNRSFALLRCMVRKIHNTCNVTRTNRFA